MACSDKIIVAERAITTGTPDVYKLQHFAHSLMYFDLKLVL